MDVREKCYHEDDLESDDDPTNFDESDVQRIENKLRRTEIEELDYSAYTPRSAPPRPPPPAHYPKTPTSPGSNIPFIDDERVTPDRPSHIKDLQGRKNKNRKKFRFSIIKDAFDGFDRSDFNGILKEFHKISGDQGLEQSWANDKVQKITEKLISKAAHRFLKVDKETGHLIGSIAGNVIFHTGGKDNRLGNIGKIYLDKLVTGKLKKKCPPFKHTAEVKEIATVESLGLDFYKERDRCLQRKILFEDPEFPASSKSLYYKTPPVGRIEWKRPGELVRDPQLIVEGHSRFDVVQGKLGDCWLLAAIANITLRDELFYRVVPPDQSFTENYAGIFHFQFWRYGRWVDVVIDDRLPTQNGKLIYMHSESVNEFWSALMEKAYAKMFLCYECLDGGLTVEALEDFTGGLTEHFDLKKMDKATVLAMLIRGFQMGSLFAASLDSDPYVYEAVMPNGLIRGHAYSVTAVQTVNSRKGEVVLLRLRNPWGNHKEWFGAWSDGSSEWMSVSQAEKTKLGIRFQNDGEFWMSFEDFYYTFEIMEICNLSAKVMDEIEEMTGVSQKALQTANVWHEDQKNGSWDLRKDTAGGCINYISSYVKNPQFLVDLSKSENNIEGDGNCTVIIAVMQKYRRELRTQGKENLPIGFSVYKAPVNRMGRLDDQFFRSNKSVARVPVFMNMREVTFRFRVPPGQYVVVPSTFEPYQAADFLIRVFSNTEVAMREI